MTVANPLAKFAISLSFPAALGNTETLPPAAVNVPFQAYSEGVIDIPDGEASATVHSVPFGAVTNASGFMLMNLSDSDKGVRFNASNANEFRIAPGSVLAMMMPAAAGATPLTSISVVTTAMQTGPVQIAYWVFGDPV